MGDITINIISGTAPFTVETIPYVEPTYIFNTLGLHTLYDLPTDCYNISITDANGCNVVVGSACFTTTTTTELPTLGYGLLYNWYAASDERNIINIGWHIPSNEDCRNLLTFVDPDAEIFLTETVSFIAGALLKEVGDTYWEFPTGNETNESGFNGKAGGLRYSDGSFEEIDGEISNPTIKWKSLYWTTLEDTSQIEDAYYSFELVGGSDTSQAGTNPYPLKTGLSIRAIKDSTLLINGQTGTYIGNDGKTYRTICIGNQEWLADSLCETKYRNGDIIPEVTDNSEWAALTTGALCAYDNDWNNV